MTGLSLDAVTANNATHPGGRRLAETADVVATVQNDNTDVVVAMKAVVAATTVSGLVSALAAQGVSAPSLTGDPPAVKVVVTSSVTGSPISSIDQTALKQAVSSAIPGGASVSVSVVATTAAPGGITTTVSSKGSADDSGAISIVAPTMSLWAAMYAFMMA
jgi:hypothetical protein